MTKLYLRLMSVIFGLVALMHLSRLLYGWHAQLGQWVVPGWVSWIGLPVTAALSIWATVLANRAK